MTDMSIYTFNKVFTAAAIGAIVAIVVFMLLQVLGGMSALNQEIMGNIPL